MIKSAKSAIFAVLGEAQVNDEEVQTIFIAVKSLLFMNSRPLKTTVTDYPNDDRVLIGNQFLIGQRRGDDFVPEGIDTGPFNPRKGKGTVPELTRHEWHR